ncbi:hypothetical protein SAMN06264849_11734 [Melghirimyces algeriensis]|uniref:Uncharacterized protein n=2 Tax=Melghirimyces algeriensis TaxID=910412 RepID=A0A521FE39_9BACL|nr:hypothetical protein SAMN06264849_11734 [Melghirimyces algeriensis]
MKLKYAFSVFLCLFLGLILFCFCTEGTVYSQSMVRDVRQIWWMNVPDLYLDDIRNQELPHLQHLIQHASVGAMNMKTGGRNTLSNSYATLGMGSRAVSPTNEMFYHAVEQVEDQEEEPVTAGVLYARRMGETFSSQSIVYPGLMNLIAENEKNTYVVKPGILSESLRRHGYATMVLGNLDEGKKPVRYAPLITMDRRGVTEEGDIGENVLVQDLDRPFGVKANYQRIGQQLLSWHKPGLAVVDLGDLYRLERVGHTMSPLLQDRLRMRILQELDDFLGQMVQKMDKHQLLVLTSSGSGSSQKEGLQPILFYQKGTDFRLLTSSTTRRTGIVSNIDLAPTLLTRLGITVPKGMMGLPMNSIPGSIKDFWNTVERVESIYNLRPSVLYSYILLQITVLLTGLIFILKNGKGRGWMESVLLAVMLAPFIFLVFSGMTAHSWWLFSGILVVSGLGLAFLLTRISTLSLFFWTGLFVFLPVVVDGLMGGPLIQQSFLGYDPIKGARYYGIGNEYMGVVLGSSILASAAWLEKREVVTRWLRWGVGLFFFFLLLFFAAPFWGTNAGGALASAVGFAVAYLRFFQKRWSTGLFLKAVGLGLIGLLLLVVLNSWLPGPSPSHIGRALADLREGDFEAVLRIIHRKLEMNLKLLRVSSWGKVFLLSLVAMAILSFRPAGGLKLLMRRYPQMFNGFAAILAGALAAIVFNDSGIVSAATSIIYVVMPFMIIAIREWSDAWEKASRPDG